MRAIPRGAKDVPTLISFWSWWDIRDGYPVSQPMLVPLLPLGW